MNRTDILQYAYHNLRSRKLRSWLTILGIILGVTAIITLISLANGVNAQISQRLTGLGNNIIQVTPGFTQATRGGGNPFGGGFAGGGGLGGPGGGTFARGNFGQFSRQSEGDLTFDDASVLRHVQGVAAVDARVQGRVRVSLHGKNASITVIGVQPFDFNQMTESTPVVAGRRLGQNDKFSAVLGFGVYNNTFRGE